ncbi:DMT family transporter [Nisaea acidiphila]|uniref:DMT family transporter n=1 Tax=Nisaea acidiphila TaxID=1862145 RepID=A0A9J7AXJ8_9PROT|nr:DMT family transporter [Nisaea acidiphila]UUX50980.1 DMT family transporter [Nisaea acidiphila]
MKSIPVSIESRNRNLSGAALLSGSVALMALQDALIKLMSTALPLGQIFLLRSMLVLPLLVLVARANAKDLRAALRPAPMLRGLCLTLMYLSLYSVLQVLPLATLAAGFYTGPLFITLLAALVLKEPVGIRSWTAVGIGFAGVLVLLRPGSGSFAAAALVPVLSGFCYAVAAILARSRCRTDAPVSLALALNLNLLIAGALMLGAGTLGPKMNPLPGWTEMSAVDWQLVAMLAVLMVGIGMGLAAAYQHAEPSVVASFDYSYLIFASLLGYYLFAETPDMPTFAGMGLIASAGLLSIAKT